MVMKGNDGLEVRELVVNFFCEVCHCIYEIKHNTNAHVESILSLDFL